MNKENILEVKDLHVDIPLSEGLLTAVRGVNFEMKKGETLGLVGESGCGKSLTCKAILGINEKKCKSSGQIMFDSEQHGEVELIDLANQKKNDKIRSIRGKEISMNTTLEYGIHVLPSLDQPRFATKSAPSPGILSTGQIPILK